MSLKVWLPLDGNLKNLGASGTEIISNGITTDINGKIGSCYSFSPDNSSYLRLNTAPFDNNTTEFSFTCWFKPNASHIGCLFSNRSSTVSAGITLWYYNSVFYFDAGDRWSSVSNASATIGAWNHLAFTWKLNGKKRIYVNGNIVGEENATTALTSATIGTAFIGAAQTTANHDAIPGGSYFNGYLNDVRIYDHALSAAEVHEIAMGLIAHYKLDYPLAGNRNYFKNLINSNLSTKNCSYEYDRATGAYTLTVTGNDGSWQQIWNTNLVTNAAEFIGKEVTISCKSITTTDSSAQPRLYLYYTPTTITSVRLYTGENKITIPSDVTNIGLILRCDQNCNSPIGTIATFSGIKMELSDKATEWSPASEDLGIDNNIIDSSGYGHYATAPSALSTTIDTPRYSTATTFDGTNYGYIQSTVVESNHLSSEYTWAGWIYRDYTDATKRYLYNDITQIYLDTDFSTRMTWYHGKSDGTASENTSDMGIIIPYREWTHLVWTFKDGYLKTYINGEYKNYSDRTGTGQFIKGYRGSQMIGTNTSSSGQWIGSISDMRIYTTALLDNDIKLLYNMGMRVDNLQNLHTFEMEELSKNYVEIGENWLNKSGTTNGINWAFNSDGSMTLNGTNTSSSNFILIWNFYDSTITSSYNGNDSIKHIPNGIYTMYTGHPKIDIQLIGSNVTGNTYTWIQSGNSTTTTVTIDDTYKYNWVRLLIRPNVTFNNFTFYPTILLNGNISLNKNSFKGNFRENQKTSFYKNKITEANEFIEI